MQRHLYHISSIQIPCFTYYVFFCIMSWGSWASVQAQGKYQCTLRMLSESLPKQAQVKPPSKWIVFVEKFDDGQLVELLAKQKIYNKAHKPLKKLLFRASPQQKIQLRFISSQQPFETYTHTFNITKDSSTQKRTMKLGDELQVTLALDQQLLGSAQAQSLWLEVDNQSTIQGVQGVRVKVKYVLPSGVSKGKGYIRALMRKNHPKPLLLYRIKEGKLLNDLIIQFTADTVKFTLFVPVHDLFMWEPTLGFQLIHMNEACLLRSFWVKCKANRNNNDQTKGQILALPTQQGQASGLLFGVALQTPVFYTKHFANGLLELGLARTVEEEKNGYYYTRFKAKQLDSWQHKVWLESSFLPYAWLAKKGDTVNLGFSASLYLNSLNSTIFYTGYPQSQSCRVMHYKAHKQVVLPPMQGLKIRPVFLKTRNKEAKPLSKKRMVHLRVRIQQYTLYQTKRYVYQKKLRFDKSKQDTLKLAKNDFITLEVISNGYPRQVLFSASISCTEDILRQKFWKLKDKYGNYLKIAVQKLTTKKDKFLHTNGKKKTKTLGGRR